MKITTISVEVKKSWNYQTFGAGTTIEIESGDDVNQIREEAMTKCRKVVMTQINIEQKAKEVK